MTEIHPPPVPLPARRPRRAAFVLGVVLAAVLLLAVGELFARLFPPRDFQPYLGDANPQTGPYAPHPTFAAGYKSWEAFVADNQSGFDRYPTFPRSPDGRPVWAMFGNSFVQAQGMLGDTARVGVPDRFVFNLGRNEPLYIRLAQIELLLDHGLTPDRIIVALMPLDAAILGDHDLARVRPTANGAIGFDLPLPRGFAGEALGATRLGTVAWVRAGWHQAVPGFHFKQLYKAVPDPVMADVRRLFAALAAVCKTHGVPVTVLLIPTYEQIVKQLGFGFQDAVAPELRALGFDVCDARAPFVAHANMPSLFIPDWHYSPPGNVVLLTTLLDQLRARGAK